MPIGLVLIVLAFLFIYLVVMRPQRRRRAEQARMWHDLDEGDEIVTAGGIYGTVTGFDGDDLLVEIAPGLVVKTARRAVAGVVSEPDDEEEEDEEDEEEDGDGLEEADAEPEETEEDGGEDDDPDEETATTGNESYPEGPR
jgi:preprotein translocase subunit YajC